MGFFREWPIWQKLVFILGCAIVITAILGCAKLGYTHWKSSTLPEKERIEQVMQRQMSQRRRAGSDVPFGIRAIESGVEVEGVWISRPNTPDGTRETSLASSKWDSGPRKDFNIDIESQDSSTNYGRVGSSSTLDRAVSAERPSSNRTSQDSSPDVNISKPAKSRHPPLAYSKYPALQHGNLTGTLEGLEAIYRASGPMDAVGSINSSVVEERLGSSDSSNKSGTDSDPISASAPRLLNRERTRQQSADLDLRRMSQAAETGQLTPRVRREHAHNAHEHGDYFCPPRKQSPPSSPGGGQDSPNGRSPTSMWSSQLDSLPPSVRKTSLPDVTPFTKFCMTAPASPLSRPSSPANSISSISSSSSSSRPSAGERTHSLPLAPPLAPRPTLVQPAPSIAQSIPPPRPSYERRDSTILRGHGTGFEILQPGTFSSPPISLQNGSARERSNSADQSRRKLQKKRRPSAESDTSTRKDGFNIA